MVKYHLGLIHVLVVAACHSANQSLLPDSHQCVWVKLHVTFICELFLKISGRYLCEVVQDIIM